MERREFLGTLGLAGLAGMGTLAGRSALAGMTSQFPSLEKAVKVGEGGKMSFVLPPLGYAYNALEPVLSAAEVRAHHTAVGGYAAGLNKTLAAIDTAVRAGDTANVRSLCEQLSYLYGGHVLHSLYFAELTPGGPKVPEGALATMIDRDFGSFSDFRRWFEAAADAVQASGWAVLAFEPLSRRLVVLQTENYQKEIGWGMIPLLAVDVWEHAYMHDYGGARAKYVTALMGIMNWRMVGDRLATASAK